MGIMGYGWVMLNGEKIGLVVFDVEGVVIPKNRYLLFEVGRRVGFSRFMRLVFYGILYELGLVSLKYALKRVFRVFKGFKVEDLLEFFRLVPLMLDVEEVFEELRGDGWKIALISSGLPDFVVEDLASRLKADYAFGLRLETRDGVVTGEVSGEVMERDGKLVVLKRILEEEGWSPDDCVVVVDDRNNVPMMLPGMLKIGFNPDFVVRVKADYVVTGRLRGILPLMMGVTQRVRVLPSRNEVLREIIHACGFTVPLLSGLVGLYPVAFLILAVTFLYVVSEWALMDGREVPIVSSIIRNAALHGELYEFATAPVFFALGILFTLFLFPVPASSAAIAIFAWGDSAAAVFGKVLGKGALPFNKGKTLGGSVIGLFFGFLAAAFFVSPLKALVGAAVAMLVECLPLPLSDNLTVPLTVGLVLNFMV